MARMRLSAVLVVAATAVLPAVGADPSLAVTHHARTLCVGPQAGCHGGIRSALKVAHNGDTITVAAGTYRGGFTIRKSVHLVGSGQKQTRIVGGKHVITVQAKKGTPEPTVTIEGLSIRGGHTTGHNGYQSFGAGVYIPLKADTDKLPPGATVTLRHVTVTHNEATASKTSPSPSGAPCPDGDCPYAQASGGGIFNAGHLTIVDSVISHNRVSGPISDADGGGIYSLTGTLRIEHSTVTHNLAHAKQIGRFAEGGGIFVVGGGFVLRHSAVTDNRADLRSSLPVHAQGQVIDMNANSGGIHIGDGATVKIADSRISHNEISARDAKGEPAAFDSAMLVGNSSFVMSRTHIEHNTGYSLAATTTDAGYSGTTFELDAGGTVSHTVIAHNSATTDAPHGAAAASNAVGIFDFYNDPRQATFRHVTILDNAATAITTNGSAVVTGAGILNNSLLTLVDSVVRGNVGIVKGTSPTAQGGGIWNGVMLSGPPVTLKLEGTTVSHNSVRGPSGATLQGGGIYTTTSITRSNSPVRHNHPDNCSGC